MPSGSGHPWTNCLHLSSLPFHFPFQVLDGKVSRLSSCPYFLTIVLSCPDAPASQPHDSAGEWAGVLQGLSTQPGNLAGQSQWPVIVRKFYFHFCLVSMLLQFSTSSFVSLISFWVLHVLISFNTLIDWLVRSGNGKIARKVQSQWKIWTCPRKTQGVSRIWNLT